MTDGILVNAQLAGDGADLPMLRVKVTTNLYVRFWIDHLDLSQDRVALPVVQYRTWQEKVLEGSGVSPDVEEPLSLPDYNSRSASFRAHVPRRHAFGATIRIH